MDIPSGSFFGLNVYANPDEHDAVHYLLSFRTSLQLSFMAGDFNLHSSSWSVTGTRHQGLAEELEEWAFEQGLLLASPSEVPTHFPHNCKLRASVLDLVWSRANLLNDPLFNVNILPDDRLLFDHAPVVTTLSFDLLYTPVMRIKPESDEDLAFHVAICNAWNHCGVNYGASPAEIQSSADGVFLHIDKVFHELATASKPSCHSKKWWNKDCREALARFWLDRGRKSRNAFSHACKLAQKEHYETIIASVCGDSRVWSLTKWTGPRSAPITSSVCGPLGHSLESLDDVRDGCTEQFFSAQNRPVDLSVLDDAPMFPKWEFFPISLQECREAVAGKACTAPGVSCLTWQHVCSVVQTPAACLALVGFYNACLSAGYWPTQFKTSITVVIPKPHKTDYSVLKVYRPIVLLECFEKLFGNVIADRLQFQATKFRLFHPSQCDGMMAHSTENAGLLLVHHVCVAQKQHLAMMCLAMDIAQCFLSIQHGYLCHVLKYFRFNERYVKCS